MAKLPISFHPDARREAEAAFDYYSERSASAADAFYQALAASQTAIQDSPQSWATYLYGTRRFLLNRFPYLVVYRATDEQIEIVAIAHGRRKPGYWAKRITA